MSLALQTNFSDGDVLYAGTTASISSINGITYRVNEKIVFGVSDTEGSIGSSATETTLANVTIPANTFTTGAIVMASIHASQAAQADYSDFKLKIGASGSETLKQTIRLNESSFDGSQKSGGSMLFYDAVEDYTSALSVIITGQNNDTAAGTVATCYQLVVVGY